MSDFMSDFTAKTTYDANYYAVGYHDTGIGDGENIRISLPSLISIIKSQLVYGTPIVALTDSSGGSADDTINPFAITEITDSTGGTASTTLSDVGSSFSQATLNNNFASIAQSLNEIKAALNGAGGNDNLASLTTKINAIHAALVNAGLITTT